MNINLEELSNIIAREVAATYFLGKYYFAVNTGRSRAHFGLSPRDQISLDIQRRMQRENETPMFHEYIHYVHEISTVVGNVGLAIELTLKSIFSHYFNSDLASSVNYGLNIRDTRFEGVLKMHLAREVINGSIEMDAKLLSIKRIKLIKSSVFIPHDNGFSETEIEIPEITTHVFEDGKYKDKHLLLGKFFIYEGIAYELDREFDRQRNSRANINDSLRRSEYTYLRLVADYLCPGIEKKVFLSVASLSLSYLDCGAMFVRFLKDISQLGNSPDAVQNYLNVKRSEVSTILLEKLGDFNGAQDEIIKVFDKRPRLKKAFTTICESAKGAYLVRAEQPTFEVDLVFNGNYQMLFDLVNICDYMYVFTDHDEFDRDFLGTTQVDEDASQATKVLVAYDHYQKAHELASTQTIEMKGGAKCPFYTSCNLPLRLDNEQTCARQPWRIFEVSTMTDRQYCWYGQAIGEFKGHTER